MFGSGYCSVRVTVGFGLGEDPFKLQLGWPSLVLGLCSRRWYSSVQLQLAALFLGKPTVALTNRPLNRAKCNQASQKRREEEEDKFVLSPPTLIFEKAIFFFFVKLECQGKAVWMGAEELQGDTLAVTKSLKGVPRVSPLRHVGSMG